MNSIEITSLLGCFHRGLFPCGSRITCKPPVLDTDEDWMVLVDITNILNVGAQLLSKGFELGGSVCINADTLESPQQFWSYTRGDLNILITSCPDFYHRFWIATQAATKLNLLDKTDRVTLFQAILYLNVDRECDIDVSTRGDRE